MASKLKKKGKVQEEQDDDIMEDEEMNELEGDVEEEEDDDEDDEENGANEEEEDDDDEEDSDEEEKEDKKRDALKNPVHEFAQFDLGNLTVFDQRRVEIGSEKEKTLHDLATKNVQLLVRELFQLPRASAASLALGEARFGKVGKSKTPGGDLASLVLLPQPLHRVPRHKPPPKPKPETKWERFARLKGIEKKKRERMIWDEDSQSWKPRFGYKRIKDSTQDPIIEVKPGDDPYANPFQAAKNEKKLRVLKNKERQLKNKEFAQSKGDLPAGIPRALGSGKGINLKEKTTEALSRAQVSTASMGKFDKRRKEEPKPVIGNRKRKFRPNVGSESFSTDKESDLRIMNRIFDKRAHTVDVPTSVAKGGTQYVRPGTEGADAGPSSRPSKKKRTEANKAKQTKSKRAKR